MPASYAHIFFGNTVYHHLPKELQESIGREKALFEIGLQGPDILFYYHPLRPNPVSATGVELHNAPGREWFSQALTELEREKGDYEVTEGAKAYVYGVLCHFVLDSQCHAYINQYADATTISHEEIESEFDRSIMVLKHKDPVSTDPIPGFHPSHRAASIAALFYPGLGVERVEAAMNSFVRFNELIRCTSDAKRDVLYTGLKLAGKYDQLHGHIISKRPNPRCEYSNAALLRRLRAAVPTAAKLIENFGAEEVQNDPIFEYNFIGEKMQ